MQTLVSAQHNALSCRQKLFHNYFTFSAHEWIFHLQASQELPKNSCFLMMLNVPYWSVQTTALSSKHLFSIARYLHKWLSFTAGVLQLNEHAYFHYNFQQWHKNTACHQKNFTHPFDKLFTQNLCIQAGMGLALTFVELVHRKIKSNFCCDYLALLHSSSGFWKMDIFNLEF